MIVRGHPGRLMAVALLVVGSCATPTPMSHPALATLLAEKKFQPSDFYTGVDTPEDAAPLNAAVDDAIRDIDAMPDSTDADAVRLRLQKLVRDVDLFATEDREMAYRYAIRIWRAAGRKDESRLFPVADERVLAPPL